MPGLLGADTSIGICQWWIAKRVKSWSKTCKKSHLL